MEKEIKAIAEQINKEFAELKAELLGRATEEEKKFGGRLGDTVAKLDLISARIDTLEVKAQRQALPKTGQVEPVNAAKTKAFETFLRKGQASLSAEEVKVLALQDDTTGGFGATQEFDTEVLKGITAISPVRELVRVRTTGARSFKTMKRTGQFAARRVGERGTRSETTGLTYGLEEVPTYELYALVDISRQDLEDTFFNLESELMTEFAEQFAKKEGTEFITGSAVNGQMEGIMTNTAISEDVSGDANNLTYQGFVDVSHNLKDGYDMRFIMNRKTLGKARQMVSGTGELLWAPMAAGAPSTILGLGYTIVPDLADVAAGNYPVACGDFKRGYVMGDRNQQVVVRDELTQLTAGAIRFYSYKRNGGQVVLAEAIRKMKISA